MFQTLLIELTHGRLCLTPGQTITWDLEFFHTCNWSNTTAWWRPFIHTGKNIKFSFYLIFLKYVSCLFFDLNPSHLNPGRIEKKLNVYFHTSFWCLKRFYEGLKGLYACMLVTSIMTIPANIYKGSLKSKYINMHSFMLCPSVMPKLVSLAYVNMFMSDVGITKPCKEFLM